MPDLSSLRHAIRQAELADEQAVLRALRHKNGPTETQRNAASERAAGFVRHIRDAAAPGLMEVFLAEYGLSTDEGIALMCLAEALLRVPDAPTIDALIEDKIAPSAWDAHLGQSSSSLVNASTWALMFTGQVLREGETPGIVQTLRRVVRRLGEPVIRTAVRHAMRELGQQFVLGQTIEEAMARAAGAMGYTYSYDMLGEAALTAADADAFFAAYAGAIDALSRKTGGATVADRPGISIKLSALHPRYEVSQRDRVMAALVPRVVDLALQAKEGGLGLNIDAEEAARLDLSLDVIEAVLRDDRFGGWDGFGVVVQAYGKRAAGVIDWLDGLARRLDRRLMVRLVKGAYWDSEIKQAQVLGIADFPVFTRKSATDISYICCAKKLLEARGRLYPQFATHNAHSAAMILELAGDVVGYEFQRLHGMGGALHDLLLTQAGARCRIYAPVGPHHDLLAYLVRRLLENGANSSFVNQITDTSIPADEVTRDPFDAFRDETTFSVTAPPDLFQPDRINSKGWDLSSPQDLAKFHAARDPFAQTTWQAGPMLAGPGDGQGAEIALRNPARPSDTVGQARLTSPTEVQTALTVATPWDAPVTTRQEVLNRAADLYEAHAGEIFALLCREAGKTAGDAIAELREAVDFLRYYGAEVVRLGAPQPRGVITCISPWNFPLAIFTGQIAAALAAGNAVLAKPADPTPLIAALGTRLLRQAGVPGSALQLLPGSGPDVGVALTSDPRVDGICFTGSTAVAQHINRAAAAHLAPDALFIAETGGINAMIVDSTALPEQAVRDILVSAFQSSGQRCSALRVLFVQDDVADTILTMLFGALDEMVLGDPWDLATDMGPVITEAARADIARYVAEARTQGRLLKHVAGPESDGLFCGPAVLSVDSMADIPREVFGPVLHVARFRAEEIDSVVAQINGSGYGLTFGLHTRIDDRVDQITGAIRAGNLYVNRNQIGAIVGSQPFGGMGLSGTGPKAGGPDYVPAFTGRPSIERPVNAQAPLADPQAVQALLSHIGTPPATLDAPREMPGPTGEANLWSRLPLGTILCLGPRPEDVAQQMDGAHAAGCPAVGVAPGAQGEGTVDGWLDRDALTNLMGFQGIALWSDKHDLTRARQALAAREGPILRLIMGPGDLTAYTQERHLCIDTTAAGGNATLLAGQEPERVRPPERSAD